MTGHDEITNVRRVTFAGMAINVAIAVAKGVGGWLFGSQALIADAVHSVSDLVTDVAVILGVKYWTAPADEDHPYGHGKIEALVTLFIAVALVAVAIGLGWDAVGDLVDGKKDAPPGVLAFPIALLSVVLKEFLFQWTRRVARTVNSPALEANAWHHRSDALSSIPVAVTVALAWFWPTLAWMDAVGALIVGVFILKVSWEIARPALADLTDAGSAEKSADVTRLALSVGGVREVHCVRTRRAGGLFHADLHVQVDATLTIEAAHEIGHQVKETIVCAGLDVVDAIVHVEPWHRNHSRTDNYLQ